MPVPFKWEEIQSDPRYAQMPADIRQRMRADYFNDMVVPTLPEEHRTPDRLERGWQAFNAAADTREPDELEKPRSWVDAVADFGYKALGTATDVLGSVVDSTELDPVSRAIPGYPLARGIHGLSGWIGEKTGWEGLSEEARRGNEQLDARVQQINAERAAKGLPSLEAERQSQPSTGAADELRSWGDSLGKQQSPRADQIDEEISRHSQQGIGDTASYALRNPGDVAAVLGAQSLPYLLPSAAAARGMGGFARAAGLSEEAGAAAVTGANLTTLAHTTAVSSAEQAAETVRNAPEEELILSAEYRALLQQTKGDEAAARQLMVDRAYGTAYATNLATQGISLGVGQRLGLNVVESKIAKEASGVEAAGAAASTRGPLMSAAAGAGKEFIGEFGEEVGDQFSQNLGENRGGARPDDRIGEGVLAAGFLGGFSGAPLGGLTGIAESAEAKRKIPPLPTIEDIKTNPDAGKQAAESVMGTAQEIAVPLTPEAKPAATNEPAAPVAPPAPVVNPEIAPLEEAAKAQIPGTERKALERERGEILATIRDHDAKVAQGVVLAPADRIEPELRTTLEARVNEINQTIAAHKAAVAATVRLNELRNAPQSTPAPVSPAAPVVAAPEAVAAPEPVQEPVVPVAPEPAVPPVNAQTEPQQTQAAEPAPAQPLTPQGTEQDLDAALTRLTESQQEVVAAPETPLAAREQRRNTPAVTPFRPFAQLARKASAHASLLQTALTNMVKTTIRQGNLNSADRQFLNSLNLKDRTTFKEVELTGKDRWRIKQLERVLGKRIAFISAYDEHGNSVPEMQALTALLHGFVMPDTDNSVMFINADQEQKSPMSIIGHEFLHLLRSTDPDLYAEWVAVAAARIKRTNKTAKERVASYEVTYAGTSRDNQDAFDEELYADFWGDLFSDESFWQELAKREPSLFQRVLTSMIEFLNSMVTKAGHNSGEMFKEVAKLRDTATDIFTRYSKQYVGPEVEDSVRLQREAKAEQLRRTIQQSQPKPREDEVVDDGEEEMVGLTELSRAEDPMMSRGRPRDFDSKVFGQTIIPAVRKAMESLSDEAQSAIRTFQFWVTNKGNRIEDPGIMAEMDAAFEPVRELLRANFGDKVRLFRAQDNNPSGERILLSWSFSADRRSGAGAFMADQYKVRSDEEINQIVAQLKERGHVTVDGNRFVRSKKYPATGNDYYMIYDRHGNVVTDMVGAETLGDNLRQYSQWNKESNDKRAASKTMHEQMVPVDEIMWIMPNAHSAEAIVRRDPAKAAAEEAPAEMPMMSRANVPRPQTQAQPRPVAPSPLAIPVRTSYLGKAKSFVERAKTSITRNFIDQFLDLKKMQDFVEKQIGGPLPMWAQPWRAENLRHGAFVDTRERAIKKFIEPVAELLEKHGLDRHEFEDYLWARHVPERDAYLRSKLDPTLPQPVYLAGMTPQEANDHIANMDPAKRQIFEQAAKDMDGLRLFTLDTLLNSGQISQEHHDALLDQYEHYVPLRGLPDGSDPDLSNAGVGAGKGLSMRSSPLGKRAAGRVSPPSDILEEMGHDLDRALIGAEKQTVLKQLSALIQLHPDKALWDIQPVVPQRKWVNGVLTVTDTTGDPNKQLLYMHNGKPLRIEIRDPYLKAALLDMNNNNLPAVVKFFGAITRVLSSVKTALNPYFILPNAVRDLQFAAIGLSAEQGRTVIRDAMKFYTFGNPWGALRKDARGMTMAQLRAAPPLVRYAREFASQGGKTGYTMAADIQQQRKDLNNLFVRHAKNELSGRTAKKVLLKTFDLIDDVNGYIENATRLATYAAMRQNGVDPKAAAEYAKNITVNFNRKGKAAREMSALYLFFNPAVQGSVRLVSLAKNKHAQRIFMGMTAASFGLALWSMHEMGDDDDGENRYEKLVGDNSAARALTVPLGGENKLTIPMPYGPNIFTHLGYVMARAMYRTQTGKRVQAAKLGSEFLGNLVGSMSPLPAERGLGAFVPEVGRIIYNEVANKGDFPGSKINYELNEYDKDKDGANWTKTSPNTGDAYKQIARAINVLTGGDAKGYEGGWLNPTGEHVRYLAAQGLGGPAKFASESYEFIEKLLIGDEVKAGDVPVVNSFIKTARAEEQPRPKFYENMDEYNHLVAVYKKASGVYDDEAQAWEVEPDVEKLQALLSENPWLDGAELDASTSEGKEAQSGTLMEFQRGTNKQIKALRDEREAVAGDDSMPTLDQRRRMRELDVEIGKQQADFNRAMNLARGQRAGN